MSSFSGIFHLDPENPDFEGSSDPQLVGFYEISGLDPGDYIISIEQVEPSFSGGSHVGSLENPKSLPGLPEFFNYDESNNDTSECADIVPVSAGEVVDNIDFIMNDFGSVGTNISESEPNESFDNAQSLPVSASISGNVAVGDDDGEIFITFIDGSKDFYEDMYSIEISTEQWCSFVLSHQNRRSDLDMFIFSEDGSLFIIPFTTAPGLTEFIGPLLLSPAKYFIGVSIVDRRFNPSTNYTLDIITTCVAGSDQIPLLTPNATTTPVPTQTPILTPEPGLTSNRHQYKH